MFLGLKNKVMHILFFKVRDCFQRLSLNQLIIPFGKVTIFTNRIKVYLPYPGRKKLVLVSLLLEDLTREQKCIAFITARRAILLKEEDSHSESISSPLLSRHLSLKCISNAVWIP